MTAPTLTIPDTLDPVHAAILREHHFVTAGIVSFVLRGDAWDGIRVLYAITNPTQTALVYVGDAEVSRSLRSRLKSHMNARDKMGHVERDSLVFVHVMVTEFMVLRRFEEDTGKLPVLNKRNTPKHMQNRDYKVNDLAAAKASAEAAKKRRAKLTTPPKPRGKKRDSYRIELLNPGPDKDGKVPKVKRKKGKKRKKDRSKTLTLLC